MDRAKSRQVCSLGRMWVGLGPPGTPESARNLPPTCPSATRHGDRVPHVELHTKHAAGAEGIRRLPLRDIQGRRTEFKAGPLRAHADAPASALRRRLQARNWRVLGRDRRLTTRATLRGHRRCAHRRQRERRGLAVPVSRELLRRRNGLLPPGGRRLRSAVRPAHPAAGPLARRSVRWRPSTRRWVCLPSTPGWA